MGYWALTSVFSIGGGGLISFILLPIYFINSFCPSSDSQCKDIGRIASQIMKSLFGGIVSKLSWPFVNRRLHMYRLVANSGILMGWLDVVIMVSTKLLPHPLHYASPRKKIYPKWLPTKNVYNSPLPYKREPIFKITPQENGAQCWHARYTHAWSNVTYMHKRMQTVQINNLIQLEYVGSIALKFKTRPLAWNMATYTVTQAG